MKPIAIVQHAPTEGPGHFATYLDNHSLPYRLLRSDTGELPHAANAFSGLAIMGGPMSVNDDLPWIPHMLDLIRDAVDQDIPVIGHCLGGQLMSKALGGVVSRNPVKEIGWCELAVADNAEARAWFGDGLKRFIGFEWHGDTFTLPQGATALLSSPWCQNQAFALGPHLGMQCHVEMDRNMVRTWCRTGAQEIADSPGPMVQSAEEIQRDLKSRLQGLNDIADRLYQRWAGGLKS
jgi:GMP synthase-like glutamine amidotransferase